MPKFCSAELLPRDLFHAVNASFLILECTCLDNVVAGFILGALVKCLHMRYEMLIALSNIEPTHVTVAAFDYCENPATLQHVSTSCTIDAIGQ